MTLRAKIISLVVFVALIGGVGTTIMMSFTMHQALSEDLFNQARLAVQTLAAQITPHVIQGDFLETQFSVDQLVGQTPSIKYAYIIDFKGKVVAHSFDGGFPKALITHHPNPHSVSAEDPEIVHFQTEEGLVMDIGYPLIDGMAAHIHLGMDEEQTRARVTAIRYRIISLALFLALAGTVLAFVMGRRMTQPLSDLAEAMRAFGEGDSHLALTPRGGGPEVSQLTEAFSRMLSDRKDIDQALRESEERIRATFNSISDAVFLHPLLEEGFAPFLEVNTTACLRYGYSHEELLKLGAKDITQIDDANSYARVGKRKDLLETKRMIFEATHITKSGESFPVEINSGIIELGGRPVILSVVRDISQRKNAEEEKEKLQAQLMQSQKMDSIGRLAGGLAHDFNNMLTIILGHSDMALQELDQEHPIHEDLAQIYKTAQRSARLTKQLLAFARKQTIAPRLVDLNESIGELLKMMRRLIGENIDLTWLPGSDIWPVKIDPSQLDQILANLCVNARDAIENIGKVTIETGTTTFDEAYCSEHSGFIPGDFVRLSVSDDGCGMDKPTAAKIFEPFYTTKGLGEGTGLGLATIYGIIKQNHGFINVYSEPEYGTTFHVYLPRQAGPIEVADSRDILLASGTNHETVLLVEDEPMILELTTKMLQNQGYTVLPASTPSEALRISKNNPGKIHLLMTDVVMPEMNGHALALELEPSRPDLKCLYMSGYTANVISHQGVLSDGVHFIQKPFSIHSLAKKIRSTLDG